MKYCNKCDTYQKEAEKYKRKYEITKSGLSVEDRQKLLELICNEQIKYMIIEDKYETKEYNLLEQLKAKIRII